MSLKLFSIQRIHAHASALRTQPPKIAPTWTARPWRRLVQLASLALFLVLFLYVCWPYGTREYAKAMAGREFIQAEAFLALDPLVSISTALAARAWVWSLTWAAVLVAACLIIPRGFCGYLCPMGTLIDLFDWAVGKRVTRLRVARDGWWVNLKYYVLAGTLAASVMGVLVSGFVAAIPIVTRGMLFILGPLQMGAMRGWYQVPAMNAGGVLSLALFAIVLGLGLLRPRFWCRYVCPTGAVFSVANFLRLAERKVQSNCIGCGQCSKACPFDAIKPDFTTRPADCTFCQTCGSVCPVHAIKFVPRWRKAKLTPGARLVASNTGRACSARDAVSRRRFIGGTLGGVAGGVLAATGIGRVFGAGIDDPARALPVRPPGSVPEREFLQLCIRCGECFKACPNNVLQPMGFQQGVEGLWTPCMVADWSGCEPSCNNCGQVCPTGAIRAIPLEEKRAARMGLAVVDAQACLPYAGLEACQMCVDECQAAGYGAIEFMRVGVEVDEQGAPIEGTGLAAPVVVADKCVGCGLCQTRCSKINVHARGLLRESAIVVRAGQGREDRIGSGSYRALREQERRAKAIQARPSESMPADDGYLPDFLK